MQTEFKFFIVFFRLVVSQVIGSTVDLTPSANSHMKLSGYGYTIGSAVSFAFHIRSSNDAFIRFVSKDSTYAPHTVFRVIIDRVMNGRRQSAIEFGNEEHISYDPFLTPNAFNTFRIGWKSGVITLNKEVEEVWETLLCAEYKTLNISAVKFVTVTSRASDSLWEIYFQDPFTNIALPNECPDEEFLLNNSSQLSTTTEIPTTSNIQAIDKLTMSSSQTSSVTVPSTTTEISSVSQPPNSRTTTVSHSQTTEDGDATDNFPTRTELNAVYSTPITKTTTEISSDSQPHNSRTTTLLSHSQTTAVGDATGNFSTSTELNTVYSTPVTNPTTEISSVSQPPNSRTTTLVSHSQTTAVGDATGNFSTRTELNTVYSTPNTNAIETTQNSTYCRLICEKNYTEDELVEMLNEVKKKLKWDKKVTSSYTRSKISAPDHRKSSTTIGYIGVIIVTTVVAGIVALDLTRLVNLTKKKMCLNKIHSQC